MPDYEDTTKLQSEPEAQEVKVSEEEEFPKSVSFIIGNEFCERFSFYGMKAILPLYLTGSLKLSQNRSTTLIHTFNFSAYFFTLFGGIISDSWLGRYRTILSLSLIYCVGMGVLAGSAFPGFEGEALKLFLIGLVLVAFGTGGIKPCVSAFGGDQFHPNQLDAISTYFSIFYFAINAGSVLSMFITPIIRQNVHCFGEDSCYPLAFGLPAILMLVATIVFVAGSEMYVKKPASSDATSLKVIKVIGSATFNRFVAIFKSNPEGDQVIKRSWLEYADISKYSREFVNETKIVLGIISVFAPISLFWALYDQQGSRWTFQALMMNGTLGPNITIKPEQMGIFNAILILILIPTFDRFVYPTLANMGISLQPLAKIFWGMSLAAVSFILAALLQFYMDARGTFTTEQPVQCVDGCVHVLWQLPQYFILTCGEVMLSITGLEFAYSQAPESMKSVCSAAWLLTVAAGNLIVILFNEMDPVTWLTSTHVMAWNFVFWAGILIIGTALFTLKASKYKYANLDELRTVSSQEEQSGNEDEERDEFIK